MVADVAQKTVWKMREASVIGDVEVLYKGIGNTDNTVKICAEHEAEAEEPEENRPQSEIHEVLHDDIAGVFGPRQARFQHGETRLHEEDQGRTEENPNRVDRRIPARFRIRR